MTTLFISDLHLCEERPDLTRAFCNFIDQYVPHAEALYLLGDFFEVWIGDDHETPFNRHIIEQLQRAASLVPTYFMHGNRDFLIGEQFCREANIQLLQEPHPLELHGTRYLLMHGDALCVDDQEYMQFRAMVRDPTWQREFLAKPLAEREAIARDLRNRSKSMSANKPEDITDVSQAEVLSVMDSENVDVLIHGHTHRPNVHRIEQNGISKKRIVLGDWGEKGWVLRINEQGEFLDSFPIHPV